MRLILATVLCLAFAVPSEAGLFRKKCGKRKPVRNAVKAVVPNCPGGQCSK